MCYNKHYDFESYIGMIVVLSFSSIFKVNISLKHVLFVEMFPPLMFFLLLFGAAFNVIIDYFDQLSEDDERQSKFPMYMADTCVLLMLLCFFEVYKAPEKHLTNRKPTRSKLSKKQLKKQDRRRKSKSKKDVPMVVVYADAASLIESWKNVCHLSSALSQNVMQWVYCNFGFSDDSGILSSMNGFIIFVEVVYSV